MSDDDRREFLQFLAEHDAPAFLRRAQGVSEAWKSVLIDCERSRNELLKMSRLRLGVLAETARYDWSGIGDLCTSPAIGQTLKEYYELWKPELRVPVSALLDRRKWRRPLLDVAAAFERFNNRWIQFAEDYDLAFVNELRDGYNKYYVIEKSAAFSSDRVGAEGFVEMEFATSSDILTAMPPLEIPSIR